MSKQEFEDRECEACGRIYTPTVSYQKYCSDCRKNGGIKVRKHYDKQVKKSIRYEQMYAPKLNTKICEVCGKEFQTTYGRTTCSDKCNTVRRKRLLICSYCRRFIIKSYEEQGLEIPDSELKKRLHFCDNKCRKAYEEESLPKRVCVNCGKEYHSNNIKFCCRQCRVEYCRTHKLSRKSSRHQEVTESMSPAYTCSICGEKCENPLCFRSLDLEGRSISGPICSRECLGVYNRAARAKSEKDRQLRLHSYIQENGMCGICTTSYSSCERMKSNFRLKPEGAKYIDGKIQVCPKFATKFK